MSTKKLDRFGRYLILDHLVDGGMAQICRARLLAENADKIVAIKMIRPQYSQDQSFKKMFIDEIKVTFGLSHPNIAQTYDYGVIKDQLYTAMEFVDGKNLKQYIDRLKEKKYIFPFEISLYLTSQICEALSYAHNFTDKLTGKKLNIIHRDISPHNVMITYDGSVKVIDFGIAKATTNSEETKAGTIKGKLSYLAPEYLETSDLDHRYDQFAVGLTLWELLCGRKLFHGDNELMILKKIQACEIPTPSSVNPNIKKELDQIVLKSLKKDRNQRYENMEQMNRSIVKFLYEHYPDFNATDLKYFANELFKTDIEEDKKKMIEFGKINITPYLEDIKKEMSGATTQSSNNTQIELGDNNKKTKPVEFDFTSENLEEDANVSKMRVNLQEKLKNAEKTDPNSTANSHGTGNHKNLTRSLQRPLEYPKDNENNVKSKKSSNLLTSFASAFIIVGILLWKVPNLRKFFPFLKSNQSASIEENQVEVNAEVDTPHNKQQNFHAPSSNHNAEMATVALINTSVFQKYYLNNQEVNLELNNLKVPLHKEVVIRIEEDGNYPIFIKAKFDKENDNSLTIPQSKKAIFGIISSSKDFPPKSTLSYNIEGFDVTLELPIGEIKVPIGSYDAFITDGNTQLKKNIHFDIKENNVFRINP